MDASGDHDDSFHIESHQSLLQRPAGHNGQQRVLDAIVVPTIRPESLQAAAVLARDIGCALVVLCSTPEQVARALPECHPAVGEVLVTYLAHETENDLLSFLTSGHLEVGIERSCHVDIARKRNVGLLLARLCAWRTIMFLDDDIRDLTVGAVSQAASLTACFQAAGFEIHEYPDNSVVCHAHRLTGGDQGVFPGGSALLVNAARCDSMFPAIYNEDWLFLYDAVRARSAAVAGTLSQFPYEPFARPGRAASEEFGDLIAEGLYRLLHQEAEVTDATGDYWRDALNRRSRLIDDIAARLLRSDVSAPTAGRALMSLAAARRRLGGITALACVSFIHAWQADRDIWRRRLVDLPAIGELAHAAKFLGLPTSESCVSQ